MNTGKLVVVTAPSGAGKTTIAKHLLHKFPQLAFSISATTRPIRPGEKDGEDYFFISVHDFNQRTTNGDFIEWEQVYEGLYYGTLKSELEKLWNAGKTVLFDVDVNGALSLKKKFPDNTLTIFIKPPSQETLIHRLKDRRTESVEKIEERIRKAAYELEFERKFDCVLINESLKSALYEAEKIVEPFLMK